MRLSRFLPLCKQYLEPGDIIIDGGNEWYENTERRQAALAKKGIFHIGMGVSGGEEGARNGESAGGGLGGLGGRVGGCSSIRWGEGPSFSLSSASGGGWRERRQACLLT